MEGVDIASRIGKRLDGKWMVEYKVEGSDSKFLGPFPTREIAKQEEAQIERILFEQLNDLDAGL